MILSALENIRINNEYLPRCPCLRLTILILILTVKRSAADCSKNNTMEENDRIEYNAPAGHLSSPGYPEYFSDTIQCTWYIFVAMRHTIDLEFELLDFGHTDPCSTGEKVNFLEVRNGALSDSKQLGKFCGRIRPEKISSSGREMWIRFKTNGYRSARFKATYKAVRGKTGLYTVVNSDLIDHFALNGNHG